RDDPGLDRRPGAHQHGRGARLPARARRSPALHLLGRLLHGREPARRRLRHVARAPGARMTTWLLAGGGTAGHVNPLLAVADELAATGDHVLVLGTAEGLESR